MPGKSNKLDVVSVRLVRDRSILADEPIDTAEAAVRIVGRYFRDFDKEVVGVICMDVKARPISMSIVSIGSTDTSYFTPKELFKPAILANASFMIMMHNHPSGDVTPSKEDIIATDRMNRLAGMMSIPLLDHIIVGSSVTGENMYSFAQNDFFNEIPKIQFAEDVEDINLKGYDTDEDIERMVI